MPLLGLILIVGVPLFSCVTELAGYFRELIRFLAEWIIDSIERRR